MVSEQKIRAMNFVKKLKALARTLFLGALPPPAQIQLMGIHHRHPSIIIIISCRS